MLSLLKIASAFSFVRRSCSSRSLLIGRPMRSVRSPRSDLVHPGRWSTVRSVATSSPPSAELEQLLVRADDADVSVSRSMAPHVLTHLERDARGVSAGSARGRLGGRRTFRPASHHLADSSPIEPSFGAQHPVNKPSERAWWKAGALAGTLPVAAMHRAEVAQG